MFTVWLIATIVACGLIRIGNNLYDQGYQQLGVVLILVGVFQLIGEMVALL